MFKGEKMKNVKISVVTLSAMLLLTSTVYASSSELEQQRKEKLQLQQQISNQVQENKSNLQSVTQDVNNVQNEILELDKKIGNLSGNIYTLETEIAALNNDIIQKTQELKDAEIKLEETQKLFGERVRAMYMSGKVDFIEVIFNSKDMEDLLLNYEIVSSIAESDNKLLDEISTQIQIINDTKASLEQNKIKVEDSKVQLEAERNQYLSVNQQKQAYMNQLQSNVQAYSREIEVAESEWANLDKEISKLQSEIKVARQKEEAEALAAKQRALANSNVRSISAKPRSGATLSWPVPNNYSISSPFGYRVHPILGTTKFHSGVDIPAATGTPVIAVKSGTVIMAKFMSGYGNVVMVDHGDMVTVYAHNSSIRVAVGQRVNTGDVISLVGSTGLSTGPHLHFEVRIDGQPVNPVNYI